MTLSEIGTFLMSGVFALSSLGPAYVLFRYVIFPLLDHERFKPEYLESENVNPGFFGGFSGSDAAKRAIAKEIEIDPNL